MLIFTVDEQQHARACARVRGRLQAGNEGFSLTYSGKLRSCRVEQEERPLEGRDEMIQEQGIVRKGDT